MFLHYIADGKLQKNDVKNYKFKEFYDVIVVGLGTAGSMAAITAAKNGLSVLGIERLNCMGGQGTAGGVFIYYLGASGGGYEQIDRQVDELSKLGHVQANQPYTPNGVNPELKKYVLEKEALKAGVQLSYESTAIGLYMDEKKAVGIQWLQEGLVKNTGATVIIDCTAEAFVCELTGCSFTVGREVDSQFQPYSSVMITFDEDKANCRYNDCGDINQYDDAELSKAVINSVTMPLHLREWYGKSDRPAVLSQCLGTREGRLIIGEETITLKKLLAGRKFDKPLFYAYSNIDVHGKDMAFESDEQQFWTAVCGLWGINISIPIPLGSLIPKGFDGLLAAGRHLAVDHDVAAAVRMKRDMQKCGEATAVVAYGAISNQCRLTEVPYPTIKAMLSESGCLDCQENDDLRLHDNCNNKVDLPVDTEEIKHILSSTSPGLAMWSCKLMGQAIIQDLKVWIHAEDEHLRKNSALALGLIGDEESLPVLRDIARERDCFFSKNSVDYRQPRGVAALFLLGDLADADSIPILSDILLNNKLPEDFETSEFIKDITDLHFQFYSYALIALIKIGTKIPYARGEIKGIIKKSMDQNNFSLQVNLKDGNGAKLNMTEKVRGIAQNQKLNWN